MDGYVQCVSGSGALRLKSVGSVMIKTILKRIDPSSMSGEEYRFSRSFKSINDLIRFIEDNRDYTIEILPRNLENNETTGNN